MSRLLGIHARPGKWLRRALAIQKESGQLAAAARTLMKMGLTYQAAFDFERARQAYEQGFDLWHKLEHWFRMRPIFLWPL